MNILQTNEQFAAWVASLCYEKASVVQEALEKNGLGGIRALLSARIASIDTLRAQLETKREASQRLLDVIDTGAVDTGASLLPQQTERVQ